MLLLVCKRLSLVVVNSRASPLSHGLCLSKFLLRPISEMSSFTDPQIFTVSYLQNSCGLSQNFAIEASKKLLIENPEKADSVLKLMRTHGLAQSQIEKIIETCPSLLLADLDDKLRPNIELLESMGFSGDGLGKLLIKEPRLFHCDIDKTVEFFRGQGFTDKQIKLLTLKRPLLYRLNANKIFKPKLDFFKSMGFADGDITNLLSSEPCILGNSLEKKIIPCFRVLKRVLGSDEKVLKAVKNGRYIIEYNLDEIIEPNMLIFKSYGVPEPLILKLFMMQPKTLLLRPQHIAEILDELMKLGFDPETSSFVLAFRSMAGISKTLWGRKLEAYKSFGLSEDEVYSAFKMQPICMLISVMKIKKTMNFFIDKFNVEPSVISKNPNILLFSLEKRIIPRCSVLQLLISTGFIKKDVKLLHYLRMTEEKFVEQLVRTYQQVLPDIVNAHKGKIEFQGFANMAVSFKL